MATFTPSPTTTCRHLLLHCCHPLRVSWNPYHSLCLRRDLLAEGASSRPEAGRISDNNAIKHDAAGGHTVVLGANRLPVTDAESAEVLMARAQEARACEATAMNAVSSRSHCVFMLYIAASHAASNTHLTGSLCLVDLAGRWVIEQGCTGCCSAASWPRLSAGERQPAWLGRPLLEAQIVRSFVYRYSCIPPLLCSFNGTMPGSVH